MIRVFAMVVFLPHSIMGKGNKADEKSKKGYFICDCSDSLSGNVDFY